MTLPEFYNKLKSTGIPVAYQFFDEKDAPDLPIIVYTVPYNNNFSADGRVYKKISHIQIELYTKKKDLETEDKVETALSSFYWTKEEEYLSDEKCYRIMYEMEV